MYGDDVPYYRHNTQRQVWIRRGDGNVCFFGRIGLNVSMAATSEEERGARRQGEKAIINYRKKS